VLESAQRLRGEPLLASVRRLASAWREAEGADSILQLLVRELQALLPLDAVELIGRDTSGIVPEAVAAFEAGEPQASGADGAAAGNTLFLPLFADHVVSHVVALTRADGAPVRATDAQLALTLVNQASAALAVLTAQAAARTDALTGLLNRGGTMARLGEEIAQADRTGRPLAVLLVDLDDFKAINARHGHLAGDEALRLVAQTLLEETRPYDHLGRYGGDEFVLVLPALEAVAAEAVAGRVQSGLRRLRGQVGGLTCSIGVAQWRPGDDAASLLDRADAPLRTGKETGKDQTRIAGPGPEGVAPTLDSVLAGEGMRFLFQPIVDLHSNTTVAFEALARGPEGSAFERPDRLLSAARDADRLVEADVALRRGALRTAAVRGLAAPATLFVNCEPETLARRSALNPLWSRDHSPFESICEITERALVRRPAELLAAVRVVRGLGWGVALDDVGADPRALALLPFLRPDVVKLDLRLVQDRPSRQLAAVVAAVNAYAEASGAALLAEGIETEEHLATALGLGATLGQGYLFGRPGTLSRPLAPPERRMPSLPSPPDASLLTPFQLIAAHRPARTADASLLSSICGHLEAQALGLGDTAIFLSCLAGAGAATAGERRRYERLAQRVGLAGVIGRDGRGGTDGMREGSVGAEEELAREWSVVVVGPQSTVALAARRMSADADRYELVLTHDRELCLAAGRALMARLEPLPD